MGKRVVQLKDGKVVKIWPGVRTAARVLTHEHKHENKKFNAANITHCCKGDRNSHQGFQWMYEEDYRLPHD